MKDENFYQHKSESLIHQGENSEFFAHLSEIVTDKCLNLGFGDVDAVATTLKNLWLPIALDLATARQKSDRTFVQGILGGQGTGKSTLCIILKLILDYLGFSVANLSIDDLYLTYKERQELQIQDPRLI